MKIAIRNILCIASMVFAVTAWGQSASVSVGSGVGAPGTVGVVVPVNLTAGQDIAGIDVNIAFATAAQYSALAVDCSAATVSSTLFNSCSVSGNVVTVRIADTGGNAWVDGLLANITVDVAGGATPMVDALVAVVVGAGDTTGTDLDPLPTATDGTFTVPAGPQPEFTGTAAGLTMATEQGLANPTGSLTVTNTGEATSLLTGTCSLVVGGSSQISMSNGGFTDIAVGAAGSVVGVACDASAAGSYAATLSCDHNGSNTNPADFPITCEIAPPGAASYVSSPAAGSTIEMTPSGDVPVGSTVPDQVLTISNGATDANDNDLVLSNCALTGGGDITVAGPGSTTIAPTASTTVTFSCSAATVASHTGAYSCDYDTDGDGTSDGTASYTVNCGVRAAASDIAVSPTNGSTISIVVPVNGSGQASVIFTEILDEGIDATIDSCIFTDGIHFDWITTLPLTVAAGTSESYTIEGTDPFDGSVSVSDTLTCSYTDSDSTPGTASWPITMTIQTAGIPTLSSWGLMLMILTMLGLGGIVIRRKTLS